eukprot:TRINITY_DN9934_c0_g2_i1.p1 TRINITY_DN9934_c0_g2~~TRINITY_DN9934_c0_g2_i1.p1  ORF type:complete len:467 (-),score=77.38 TRINITY_DN9934_c0_g2_i1:17-1417(-)
MRYWTSLVDRAQSFESTFTTKKDKFVVVQIVLDTDSDNSNPLYIGTLTDITFQKTSEKSKIDQIDRRWQATLATQQSDQRKLFQNQQLFTNQNTCECSTAITLCLDQLEASTKFIRDNEKEISMNTMTNICEEMDGYLAVIRACTASQRAAAETVLNDLRGFASKTTDFIIEDLMNALKHMFEGQSERKNIEIIYHHSKEKSILRGDPYLLLQIFIAFVSNALKFTPDQQPIEVFLDCQISKEKPDSKMITFTVKDNGVGLSQETMDFIFTPFVSVRYDYSRGLLIAKRAADLLNGHIKIESEVNRGSTFTFSVDMECGTKEKKAVFHEQKLSYNVNVLIAEDNYINQKLLARILLGCNIVFANNGLEAVNIFKEETEIDVIFMDIQMPVMDGIEATGIIRDLEKIDNRKPIPIIATLAYPLKGESERKEYEQFTLCIEKPLSREKVMKKIHDLITKYREECKNKI